MDPDTWVLIWLIVAGMFVVGEMVSPGFYLLPFGISAAAALVLALVGVPVAVQWVVFIVLGAGSAYWFLKYFKKHESDTQLPTGVGVDRLLGETGPIIAAVPAGPTNTGRVMLGAEEWIAESADQAQISDGTVVEVVEVKGTRVIVVPKTSTKGTS
ncbi:MAG: NfeD family protein [Actinomycetia bacterium]|nr:NfeD family protein [Actinomycetes bacterium]MCP4959393.1 NfeD family protein [Actinomycetes bacterium]